MMRDRISSIFDIGNRIAKYNTSYQMNLARVNEVSSRSLDGKGSGKCGELTVRKVCGVGHEGSAILQWSKRSGFQVVCLHSIHWLMMVVESRHAG